ncbi:hypothetical protein GCM10010156_49620 [Planobispora rosea]|uniref:VWFA domain-containing protein n=1 Tax=Planobispora rosea TaxID=35762 RepID=A0A8J3SAW9_PLARO|nr:VWA domain-containing protein [Planobispora rosea]GGS85090.1 hypothetical protein GCM10010156_49620 [Planobispora rosea]GIH86473.1 hypothetical protein Pro02_48810 [Planobispora rosea]
MRVNAKLKDLAARAGRCLGLARTPATHTQVIEADRFDEMTWRETLTQATALRRLADDLADRHHYTTDLVRDVWTAAYKTAPQLRTRAQVDPSRAVNHQVISALVDTPEFIELRRTTIGDAYAAAMAVLAHGSALREMLEHSRDSQQAAEAAQQARQQAVQAAQRVQAALEAVNADADVGDVAVQQLETALAAAEAAFDAVGQAEAHTQGALEQAAPGIRAAARTGTAAATQQARAETAQMAAWGIDAGRLRRMSFAERAELAQLITGHRLAAFTELIGRFRAMAAGERARRIPHARGELAGITVGDDLAHLVPSELAALAVPALRADFAARLAEGRLMVYDTQGEEQAGNGAIIALVDCSGSMTRQEDGISREAWAKACALALLDQARAAGRHFVGILFASAGQRQIFDFPRGQAPLPQVLEFAEHFFDGGTDFAGPLEAAADILAESYDVDDLSHGDIVLITDGECDLTPEWMTRWQQRKTAVGFRVFGVSVAHRPGRILAELCDDVRHITDLADVEAPRSMFRLI